MLKRTLFFVNPYHLSVRNKQLVVTNKQNNLDKTIPIEDIGFIILDNKQITITQSVFEEFAINNVALIVCNEKHHPVTMNLNLETNTLQGELFSLQLSVSEPLKKNLWKDIIKCKIYNQAMLLKKLGKNFEPLLTLQNGVKSDDVTNREGRAALLYWRQLFDGEQFRRNRTGEEPNSMFNYAYAVLRAGVAKALMGSGLLPTLGIHHRNRYNAYRLADDVMEPYRPIVDQWVIKVYNKHKLYEELTTEIKLELLELLTIDVEFETVKRPLMVALSITTASLAKCFRGERRKIMYPKLKA